MAGWGWTGRTARRYVSPSERWETPEDVFRALDAEFHFTLDPCPSRPPAEAGLPLFGTDGLSRSWAGERVFCNPPYGPRIARWLEKAREADCTVYLLPARTDTRWWHDHAMQADEIRFCRGRLRFGTAAHGAPFASCILVFHSGRAESETPTRPRVIGRPHPCTT